MMCLVEEPILARTISGAMATVRGVLTSLIILCRVSVSFFSRKRMLKASLKGMEGYDVSIVEAI